MGKRGTVTLAEVLVLVAMLALAVGVLAVAFHWRNAEREIARRMRCRGNLNQLAKGLATYLNECGDNRFYPWPAGRPGCGTVGKPSFGGAEWLATLYWTMIIPDPGCFLCPSSADSENWDGALLGRGGCPGGRRLHPHAVSYAAMGHESVGLYLVSKQGKAASYAASVLAIRDDFPPNEPMACDDTQEPINHGRRRNGGMCILFFDSHVEYWTHEKIDLERGVGTGELVHLRN
jgi:hypothetical protein